MFIQDRHLPVSIVRVAFCVCFSFASVAIAAAWEHTIKKEPPGNFADLRPLQATYVFGWSGFTAAIGDVKFARSGANRFQLDGKARTLGLARLSWKLDANLTAVTDAETLRPIDFKQFEVYRSQNIVTQLSFRGNSVHGDRTEGSKAKTRDFSYPGLFDLQSAMLYVRSQPLKPQSVYRILVYPATDPYLATLTVVGREKVSVRAGTFDAIKLDLKLKRVGKNLQLETYRKFRRGTIWVADNSDRLLLRLESQIFIGTIFAELQAVRYETPKS